MEVEIKTIPLFKLNSGIPCEAPDPKDVMVTENDSACRVMTDFSKVNPVTIEPIVSIDRAVHKMRTVGVRLLLVTDEHDDIGGIITSYDIQSEKPVKYAETNGISHTAITVGMIMTPIEETPAFDYDFVRQSLVRHVINTMKELNRPHTLVVEKRGENRQVIRGMFSTSQISKILGKSIYEPLHSAQSLADMQHDMGQF